MSEAMFSYQKRFNSFYAELTTALSKQHPFQDSFAGTLVEIDNPEIYMSDVTYNVKINNGVTKSFKISDEVRLDTIVNYVLDNINPYKEGVFFNDEDFENVCDLLDSTNGNPSTIIPLEYKGVKFFVVGATVYILDRKVLETSIASPKAMDKWLELRNGPTSKYVRIVNLIEYVHSKGKDEYLVHAEKIFEEIEEGVSRLYEKEVSQPLNLVTSFPDVNLAVFTDATLKKFILAKMDGYEIAYSYEATDNLSELRLTLNNLIWEIVAERDEVQ